MVDESWVLPAILRLGGDPMVTDRGDIVYTFPELGVTAIDPATTAAPPVAAAAAVQSRGGLMGAFLPQAGSSSRSSSIERGAPPEKKLIQEKMIRFSRARPDQQAVAAGLGIVNLGGALWLGNVIRQASLRALNPGVSLSLLARLHPWLLLYAVLYNAIPLVRGRIIEQKNAQISERNARRQAWRAYLDSPDTTLAAKLKAASKISATLRANDQREATTAPRLIAEGSPDIMYTTRPEDASCEQERSFDDRLAQRVARSRQGDGGGAAMK